MKFNWLILTLESPARKNCFGKLTIEVSFTREQVAVTASHSPRDQHDFVEDNNVSKTILIHCVYHFSTVVDFSSEK